MLSRIKEFVKRYQADIILVIGVILISLLSFAMGYIVARQQEKEPLKIEFRDSPYRKGVGETLRFPRIGKQAFAEGENVRNRGCLKSEPEVPLKAGRQCGALDKGERLI